MTESWYVIEAEEGNAFKAQLQLAVAGLHVWLPVILKRRAARRRQSAKPRRDTRSPRFGRYFFIRCEMSDVLWHAIKNSRFVRRLLSATVDGRPTSVPAAAIEWLMEKTTTEEKAKPKIPYQIGDVLRIVDGPFLGSIGPVQGIDESGIVCLSVALFGRSVPLPLSIEYVEPVSPQRVKQAEPRGPDETKTGNSRKRARSIPMAAV